MKFLFGVLILVSLISTTSWSETNPQTRACRLAGAEFLIVASQEFIQGDDQVGLCVFSGGATLGSIDTLLFQNDETLSISALAYLNGEKICSGQIVNAHHLNTQIAMKLCQYDDLSVIDLKTLSKGLNHKDNKSLTDFLKK